VQWQAYRMPERITTTGFVSDLCQPVRRLARESASS
jgi:hypothetical protein